MKLRYLIPLVVIVIAGYMWASSNDYEDALKEQQTYCDNVGAGFWPDYKGIYKEICK